MTKKLTIEEHVDIGNKLKSARAKFLAISLAYPGGSSTHQEAKATMARIDELQEPLYEEVCELVAGMGPDADPRNLAPFVHQHAEVFERREARDPADAFDRWTRNLPPPSTNRTLTLVPASEIAMRHFKRLPADELAELSNKVKDAHDTVEGMLRTGAHKKATLRAALLASKRITQLRLLIGEEMSRSFGERD